MQKILYPVSLESAADLFYATQIRKKYPPSECDDMWRAIKEYIAINEINSLKDFIENYKTNCHHAPRVGKFYEFVKANLIYEEMSINKQIEHKDDFYYSRFMYAANLPVIFKNYIDFYEYKYADPRFVRDVNKEVSSIHDFGGSSFLYNLVMFLLHNQEHLELNGQISDELILGIIRDSIMLIENINKNDVTTIANSIRQLLEWVSGYYKHEAQLDLDEIFEKVDEGVKYIRLFNMS